MANWRAFQGGVNTLGGQLAERQQAEQQRKQTMQDMFMKALMEAEIKKKYASPAEPGKYSKEALEFEKAKASFKPPSTQDIKQLYETDVKKAISGQVPWESLRFKYPLKTKEIGELRPQFTPMTKSPQFQQGGGLPALFSRFKAKITPQTQAVIDNIKTEADWNHFIENLEDYQKAGIDTKAIMEYFGKR